MQGPPSPFLVFALACPDPSLPQASNSWIEAGKMLRERSKLIQMRSPNVDVNFLHPPGLRFPESLLRNISRQSYSVFSRDEPSSNHTSYEQDTRELIHIVSRAGGKFVQAKYGAVFCFIHLENFRHLHSYPGLHLRRRNLNTQFWLYGSSPYYPPRLQSGSVMQVFPKGNRCSSFLDTLKLMTYFRRCDDFHCTNHCREAQRNRCSHLQGQ
jgi:hypothetical protein